MTKRQIFGITLMVIGAGLFGAGFVLVLIQHAPT